MLFDSHNHLQQLGESCKLTELVGEMQIAGIQGCVVNATSEEDWEIVSKLAFEHPDFIRPAYGIHPWKAHLANPGWETRLREILLSNPHASIGEAGLDGWVKAPSIDIQRPIFETQLQLAAELHRPITIHCLKAWEPLFSVLDALDLVPEKLLLHSFGGSIEIAQRLKKYNAYFSFSGYFLHPRKSKVLDVYRQLPRDRLLLETDAPDMSPPDKFIDHPLAGGKNHPTNLRRISDALAAALGTESLSQIQRNSKAFWGE